MNVTTSIITPITKTALTVGFERVTPALAQRWLDRNHHLNRAIKKGVMESYARSMVAGNWNPDGCEPVRLSDKGTLIDGQHRLTAVTVANKAVWMMVISGVPEGAMSTIDDGVKRSLSDQFKINGIKIKGRATSISGSVITLNMLRKCFQHNRTLNAVRSTIGRATTTDLIDFHSRLKGFNASMDKFAKTFAYNKVGQMIPLGSIMPLYYLLDQVDPEVCFSLVKSLELQMPFEGDHHSPIYYVIQHIRRNKDLGVPMRAHDYVSMFMWAYKETKQRSIIDRTPAKFAWPFDEDFENSHAIKAILKRI